MLFHISTNPNLDKNLLVPRIPESASSYNEDTTTPRVCFSPSINGCIQALCSDVGEHLPDILDTIKNYNSSKTCIRDKPPFCESKFVKEYNVNKKYDESDFNFIELLLTTSKSIEVIESAAYYDFLREGYPNRLYPFYYIYTPDEDVYACDCEVPSVFDQELTHEIWVKRPIKVRRIATMYVIGTNRIKHVKCTMINGKKYPFMMREFAYKLLPPNYTSPWIEHLTKYYDENYSNSTNMNMPIPDTSTKAKTPKLKNENSNKSKKEKAKNENLDKN